MTEQAPREAAASGRRGTGIVQVVDLEAAPHSWEASPGVIIHGHAFNGQVPGPTIEATVGDTLAVRFTNRLSEPVDIQWRGLPDQPVTAEGTLPWGPAQPGTSREYQILLSHSGTFCYHVPATTAIGPGLHGLLMVRPDAAALPRHPVRQFPPPDGSVSRDGDDHSVPEHSHPPT